LLAWSESRRDRRQDLEVRLRSVVLPGVLPRPGPAIQIHVASDFVTIRVLKGNLEALVILKKGLHVRMHGFLHHGS
jgi:hypothetical protein